MAQLTYNTAPQAGTPGMLYDNGPADILSKLAQGTVNVGTLAGYGTDGQASGTVNPGQVATLATGIASPMPENSWLGVIVRDPSLAPQFVNVGLTVGAYADKDSVPVLHKGRIWVATETATTEGHDVYVRTTAGTAGQVLGNFADGAAANFSLLPGARWVTTSTAGCAALELK